MKKLHVLFPIFQADITYPEPHLQNASISNREVKGKSGVQCSMFKKE